MARTAMPYEAVAPAASSDPSIVVGSAPTMRSRNVHGTGYWLGIIVSGEKGTGMVPIEPVHAAARSVSTPYVQPSTVAPDAIKPALFVTNNLFSPVSHPEFRYKFSTIIPARALIPLTKLPGVNSKSRRPSGAEFIIPFPFGYQTWPDSVQWLSDRMRSNQI